MSWKQATTDEIAQYYQTEFDEYFNQIPAFIRGFQPKEIGIAFQDAYPVKNDDIPNKQFVRRDAFGGDSSDFTRWLGDGGIQAVHQVPASERPD